MALSDRLKDWLPLPLRKKLMDRRYATFLFSRFPDVEFDSDSWRMTTPEPIARHLAAPFHGKRILDAFAGLGSNTIQFALAGNTVTAIERDPNIFRFLEHNCAAYGVRADVTPINTDIFGFTRTQPPTFDLLYLDPPFADLDQLLARQPDDQPSLRALWPLAPLKILKLPISFDPTRLAPLGHCIVKKIFLNDRPFYLEAWFDDTATQKEPLIPREESVHWPE